MAFLLWVVIGFILVAMFVTANIWMGELAGVVGGGEDPVPGVYGILAFSLLLSILYSWAVYSMLD